jgi:hypothetical protein
MGGANLPCMLRATTDFVYVRMHGPDHQHLYAGSYSDADLTWWADRIREWSLARHDVLLYFNNDGDANAIGTRGPSKHCWCPMVSAIRPHPSSTQAKGSRLCLVAKTPCVAEVPAR